MKKILILIALVITATINARAQNNGDVYVINVTNCDIDILLYARCPDNCNTYSRSQTKTIPANTGFPGMKIFDASLSTPNPFYLAMDTDPETVCPGEWRWSYAEVSTPCGLKTVGNPLDPCGSYQKVVALADSECSECYNGQDIFVRWNRILGIPNSTAITFGQ